MSLYKCRNRCGGKWDSGFTLLELMISITILSMIAVIIASVFRLGLGAWERGEEEAEAVQTMRVLSGLVFQQLKSAYPYKIRMDDENVVVFKGEPDSMIFVITLSAPYPGGFKWVHYLHKDGALLYKEGMLPDKELIDTIPGDEELVETDVEEVKFQYYSDDEKEWKDTWEYSDKLPGAVRAQISYFQPIVVDIPMSREAKETEEVRESVIEEI
ncbi:MAG: prepilin-type N-terminal cleavage/methylation domain-containing protein [Nitrospira sp.]|nr:prepilin-type N-terminal cleavage/methylation domain-containing protein [Nitrospira sp.]